MLATLLCENELKSIKDRNSIFMLDSHQRHVCVAESKCVHACIPQVFPWEFSVLFTAELIEEALSVLSWGPVGGLL